MEELKLNLSKNEFSTGRKVLLWIVGSMFTLGGLWDLYLRLIKNDNSVHAGLTATLFSISAFVYFIAALATFKRKEHYFNVKEDSISYRYGLIFPKHHSHKWEEVKKINMLYQQRKAVLILTNGKEEIINLNWVDRNNAKTILKHIYYSARSKNIQVNRK